MTKLVNGKIPAFEICPYKDECSMAETSCHHKGKDHNVPFSCGAARAYELIHRFDNRSKFPTQ